MPGLAGVVINCADPIALADFYRRAIGWEVTASEADYAALRGDGTVQLGFQRVDEYRAPGWPGPGTQHSHLDISVADLAQATTELLAIGATRPELQPGGDDWVVLADPEGHVFCLVTE